MREFFGGARYLLRGFGQWRQRPGAMALALVPAAIVGAFFLAGLVALLISLPQLTETLSPFADTWPEVWRTLVQAAIGAALVGAAIVLWAVSFTAVTLIVGEPFYERIWRGVERDAGGVHGDAGIGFWRSVLDGVWLFVRGVGVALAAAVLGLIPVVGGAVSTTFAVVCTGWLLSDELCSRALGARGLGARARRALRRGRRARLLGFGVATQLCFLVPLGAVLTMPAAVAGSTLLARSVLADSGDSGA